MRTGTSALALVAGMAVVAASLFACSTEPVPGSRDTGVVPKKPDAGCSNPCSGVCCYSDEVCRSGTCQAIQPLDGAILAADASGAPDGSSAPSDASAALDAGAGPLDAAVARDASTVDSGPDPCPPVPGVAPRAIVAGLIKDVGADSVKVFSLESGGRVVDHNLEFSGGFTTPRHVAIRPDGLEAMIAFSPAGGDYGIVVISIDKEGTAAQLVQTLVLGTDQMAYGLDYVSNDRAVLALAMGPTGHSLLSLERGTGGKFAAGTSALVPGDWPMQVARRSTTGEAVMIRVDLSQDTSSEVRPLAYGASGWVSSGASGFVTPNSTTIAVNPNGQRVYSPTSDPNDHVTPSHLMQAGLLFGFHWAGTDLVADPIFALPHACDEITVDPGGQFLVMERPIIIVDGSGYYTVRSYKFQTVSLDAAGLPTTATVSDDEVPALLFHGLTLTAGGVLVTALALYPDQVPSPGKEYPLMAWRQATPGKWKQACDTVWLTGQPTIAVVP